jgi:hypothetical protein
MQVSSVVPIIILNTVTADGRCLVASHFMIHQEYRSAKKKTLSQSGRGAAGKVGARHAVPLQAPVRAGGAVGGTGVAAGRELTGALYGIEWAFDDGTEDRA